jgi:prophage regulatory protein
MTVEFSAAGNLDVLLEIITSKQFDALLKIDQVEAITSFKKSYIYREMAAGTFPPSTPVGGGTRWYLSDVLTWVLAQRRTQPWVPEGGIRADRQVFSNGHQTGTNH